MFNHDLSKVQSQTGNPGGYARPYDLRNVVSAQESKGKSNISKTLASGLGRGCYWPA